MCLVLMMSFLVVSLEKPNNTGTLQKKQSHVVCPINPTRQIKPPKRQDQTVDATPSPLGGRLGHRWTAYQLQANTSRQAPVCPNPFCGVPKPKADILRAPQNLRCPVDFHKKRQGILFCLVKLSRGNPKNPQTSRKTSNTKKAESTGRLGNS